MGKVDVGVFVWCGFGGVGEGKGVKDLRFILLYTLFY